MLLTVFEHQTLRQKDFIQAFGMASDFEWLLAQIQQQQLPCFSIGYSGQVVINVRHFLAVIRVPSGNIIEILPKISKDYDSNPKPTRTWVAQMLADIYGLKQQTIPTLTQSTLQQHNQIKDWQTQDWKTWLQPLIDEWFGLLQNLPALLPRHYQQQYQNNPQAQGKLQIKEQIRHNSHRPHYRYTNQQQLDLHPLWGQFFITALQKVKGLGIATSNETMQSVQAISAANLVSLPASKWKSSYQQLKQMLANSNVQRDAHSRQQLDMTVELAWLILQIQDVANAIPIFGNYVVPAIMINMQQAFEQWVSIKLADHFEGKVQPQARFTWLQNDEDKSHTRCLKPDVLIYDEQEQHKHKIAIVADIKYKHIDDVAQVNTSDLYQLFTYQQFLKAKQAWLIYPMSKTFTNSAELTVQHPNKTEEKRQKIKVIPFNVLTGEILF